jgi:ribosomal protein S18 acetylase RimI-like enzyme
VISYNEVRLIEELNLNAWPALGQVIIDGWVVRFAEGYSRRANSANALFPGKLSPGELIPLFESHYKQQCLRSCIRITPLVPRHLNEELDQLGYGYEAETIVMRAEIPDAQAQEGVEISPKPSADWLTHYEKTSPRPDFRADTLRKILTALVPDAGFALLRQDGVPVSFAIGVAERGHLAVLNVATNPTVRRRGFSKKVLESLYAWGKARGAHTAHLNVQGDNTRAVDLYSGLGFNEIYRYVYRVKELANPRDPAHFCPLARA